MAAVVLLPTPSSAQPLRLRADALTSAEPPAGLIILQAEGHEPSWLDAEALVWTGAESDDGSDDVGDALVVRLRLRDPEGRGEAKVGRFIATTGSIRPRHLDGASVRVRTPIGTNIEAFGGVPVAPQLGDAWDWLVGTRVSHRFGDWLTAGIAFVNERDRGFLADQEIGADIASHPTKYIDVVARSAVDLINPGIADAHVSAAYRTRAWRYELFGSRRSPARMLPATSLFSVLGDVPSDRAGGAVRWRAAPRLDVWGHLAYRSVGSERGADFSTRAVLRLDPRGDGFVGLELKRWELGELSSWTGIRATGRRPINRTWLASIEAELVIPDSPRGRGAAWPWGLCALVWKPNASWEAAAAIEGRASPESKGALSGLLRLTRRWGKP